MPDETDDPPWPPAQFAEQLQEASETVADGQLRLLRSLLAAGGGGAGVGAGRNGPSAGLGDIGALGQEAAVFKTRVQSGGRISIPDAEREALDIDEGDIVQAVVVPIPSGDEDR